MQTANSCKIEQSIRAQHESREELFLELEKNVLELIKDACEDNKWIFIHRIKKLESYALKLLTGRTQGYDIDDFLACTIVVPNLKNIGSAKNLVRSCFDIIDEKPNEYVNSRPSEFNFDGIRFYCKLHESVQRTDKSDLSFEIQIKTLLEYAWSEATHDFSYKGSSVSWAKERLATQLKATLSNIDLTLYDMEAISASEFLNKKNKNYERLESVLNFLKKSFVETYDIPIPDDIKRLAESVDRILTRTKLELTDLEKALLDDTALGRGYQTLNLSVYSIILVAIFEHQNAKVVAGLQDKPPYYESNIVIPAETMLKAKYEDSKFKKVVFL